MDPDTLNETIEISRQQIEQLGGERNWSTWKFRIMIMLRVKNAFEIIDGRLNMPAQPAVGAADEVINQFRSELEAFNKAEVAALQILTSHMSTEILVMVMRFRSAREMWLELERLFDGNSEDRLYSLGMQFFASIEMDQEMTIHMSRLKTLFNDFNAEICSVTAAHDKNKDSCFVTRPTSCHFKINGRTVMVGNREFEGGLFKAALRTKSQTQEVNSLSDDLTLQLYHERMAHQNKHHIKKLIERELGIKVQADIETCEGCIYGKAHQVN